MLFQENNLIFPLIFSFAYSITDGSSPVQIKEIRLSPHPVTLRKGAKVTASGKFRVSGAAGTQYKLHLKLERYVGWWWNTIPCSWYKQW